MEETSTTTILQEKYLLIQKEVSEVDQKANVMFNEYIKKFEEYCEKRKEDLEKWRENEITYVEDEKERSISGCNSDCDSYLTQLDTRYKMFLRFKLETLKKYFPDQYEYYRQNGLSIIQDLEMVPSVSEERAPLSSIRFTDKPLLSVQDIRNDINSIPDNQEHQVKKNSVLIHGKSYKVGDIIDIQLLPNLTYTAQILFLKPQVTLIIDDNQFEMTLERFITLVDESTDY